MVPVSMDDAARMRPGSLRHRFVQMHWPVWWVGGSLVFALACGELTLGLLLAPPGHATLAVRVFNLNHYGQPDLVAALCLVQVAISLSPMLATSALIAMREAP
jgi:ABC-type Fe3+ transport system permease subunit